MGKNFATNPMVMMSSGPLLYFAFRHPWVVTIENIAMSASSLGFGLGWAWQFQRKFSWLDSFLKEKCCLCTLACISFSKSEMKVFKGNYCSGKPSNCYFVVLDITLDITTIEVEVNLRWINLASIGRGRSDFFVNFLRTFALANFLWWWWRLVRCNSNFVFTHCHRVKKFHFLGISK